jgi:hypothetical protein
MRATKLMLQLWNDDCGAILTAEYMMLFGIVSMGAAQGLTTLRDTTNAELAEVGNMVRETRLQFAPPIAKKQTPPATGDKLASNGTQDSPRCYNGMCP